MRTLRTAIIGIFFFASGGLAQSTRPWATSVPFEPIKDFGTVRIPNGDAPVSHTVEFPAVTRRPDARVVLRFESRVDNPRPAGWNYYLGIELNGVRVSGYTADGTRRLVNRGETVTLDEGRVYTWPWWNRVQDNEISLLTFFGPGGSTLDDRIKSDRGEFYWNVVDVTDLVIYSDAGPAGAMAGARSNVLVLTNNLLSRYVGGARMEIVLGNFAVGYIPSEAWKQRVGGANAAVTEIADALVLKGPDYEVRIGRGGVLHLVRDGQVFAVESRFSHPGDAIRWYAFAAEAGEPPLGWGPSVEGQGDAGATVSGHTAAYDLVRTVTVAEHRVIVRDTFRNLTDEPVGIMIEHSFATPAPLVEALLGGVPVLAQEYFPENPTIFLRGGSANLGVLAEDDVFRLQIIGAVRPNRAVARIEHFGLDAHSDYTFEWALYPMPPQADYWAFINRVRRDWNVNFTIEGPWDFFHVQRKASLLRDPDAMRAYLRRKNLGIVALAPWIDYENYDEETGGLVTREKYKSLMTEAARAFRAVNPAIRVTGCMESFPISLSLEDSRTLRDRLPPDERKQGYPKVTREMLTGLGSLTERDKDSLFVSPDGRLTVELYYRGPGETWQERTPMVAIAAYPAMGNAQHDRLMDQARFIMEECGLDGIYIDSFSLAYEGNMAHLRYDYSKWDGRTVDIDPATGRVVRRYTDAALAGATSRAALIQYVIGRGGVFVANSYAAVRETQSLRAYRFSESEYCFDPLALKRGEKPPLFYRMCGGQLSTPIGLGYRPVRLRPRDADNYARILVKTAITYLRYGGLYYHYGSEIPEEGPGSGDYGPFNHMFPITPVELREGAIIGRERIVTAVSGQFDIESQGAPRVLLFDITGREVPHSMKPVETADGVWRVQVELEDWESIAVVEAQ